MPTTQNCSAPTLTSALPCAKRLKFRQTQIRGRLPLSLLAALVLSTAASNSAFAVDGCLVLLCFAAPNWRAVPQCVPVIRQVLRDLARGRVLPHCGMSGTGNSATHESASAPDNCPPQYTRYLERPNGVVPICQFSGAVAIKVRDDLWSRTWWAFNGDSVTEFSREAKQQLGQWDPRFDEDYARWLAAQPVSECSDC